MSMYLVQPGPDAARREACSALPDAPVIEDAPALDPSLTSPARGMRTRVAALLEASAGWQLGLARRLRPAPNLAGCR